MYTSVASKSSTGEGDGVVVCDCVSIAVSFDTDEGDKLDVRNTVCVPIVFVSVDFGGSRVVRLGQVTVYPLTAHEAFKENS